jgi:hypothetical protein
MFLIILLLIDRLLKYTAVNISALYHRIHLRGYHDGITRFLLSTSVPFLWFINSVCTDVMCLAHLQYYCSLLTYSLCVVLLLSPSLRLCCRIHSIVIISYPCCSKSYCIPSTLFLKLVSCFENIVSTTDVIKRSLKYFYVNIIHNLQMKNKNFTKRRSRKNIWTLLYYWYVLYLDTPH